MPSAIRKVLVDGVGSPNTPFNDGNVVLQIAFTNAPSSNRPLIFIGICLSPFNSTACTNGRVTVSGSLSRT